MNISEFDFWGLSEQSLTKRTIGNLEVGGCCSTIKWILRCIRSCWVVEASHLIAPNGTLYIENDPGMRPLTGLPSVIQSFCSHDNDLHLLFETYFIYCNLQLRLNFSKHTQEWFDSSADSFSGPSSCILLHTEEFKIETTSPIPSV